MEKYRAIPAGDRGRVVGARGGTVADTGSARHVSNSKWQILSMIDRGSNVGGQKSTFVDCIWQFLKLIARVNVSRLCYCMSRVYSALTQLEDHGVHDLVLNAGDFGQEDFLGST